MLSASSFGALSLAACGSSDTSSAARASNEVPVLSLAKITSVQVNTSGKRGLPRFPARAFPEKSDQQILSDIAEAARSRVLNLGSGTPITLYITVESLNVPVFGRTAASAIRGAISGGAPDPSNGGLRILGGFHVYGDHVSGPSGIDLEATYRKLLAQFAMQIRADLENETVKVN